MATSSDICVEEFAMLDISYTKYIKLIKNYVFK